MFCSNTRAVLSEGEKTVFVVCSNVFVVVIAQTDVAVSPDSIFKL